MPSNPFKPTLLFVGKSMSLPLSGAQIRLSLIKTGSAIFNGRDPNGCSVRVSNSKLGRIGRMRGEHAHPSRVENLPQVLSCLLKPVYD